MTIMGGEDEAEKALAAQLGQGVPVVAALVQAQAAVGPEFSKQSPDEAWAAASSARAFVQVRMGAQLACVVCLVVCAAGR